MATLWQWSPGHTMLGDLSREENGHGKDTHRAAQRDRSCVVRRLALHHRISEACVLAWHACAGDLALRHRRGARCMASLRQATIVAHGIASRFSKSLHAPF